MSVQAPEGVVMIRPKRFHPNPQTAADNAFQSLPEAGADEVAVLCARGVAVHVFRDTRDDTPDSVFPNNWFSTHSGGYVAVYPMYAENRRKERRADVIEMLKRDYRVQEVIDFSGLEQDGLALEGTGAMVIDHIGRVAFVARSHRADPVLLERFCTRFGYEPIVFDAVDATGAPVYHTNVLMTIGTHVALVGLDMVADAERRQTIVERLQETGREVVDLTRAQIGDFAGNAIELATPDGRILVLSARALASLTPDQVAVLERSVMPVPLDLATIESAGGSARCMIAGLHLARRTQTQEENVT